MSNLKRAKNRREGGTFLSLPHDVLRSQNYQNLSRDARAMLVEIGLQYDGNNNGNISCPHSYLKTRGWVCSPNTCYKTLRELIHFGMIVQTQFGGLKCGGRNRPSLYALSWLPIQTVEYSDGFSGRTDWAIGDTPRTWKQTKSQLKSNKQNKEKQAQKNDQLSLRYPSAIRGIVVEGKFA